MEQTVSDLIDLTDPRAEATPNAVGHLGDDELSDTGNSAGNSQRGCFQREGVESAASTTQVGVGTTASAVYNESDEPSNVGHVPGTEAPPRPLDDHTKTEVRASTLATSTREEGNSAKPKKRKRAPARKPADKDGERCTICLDPWTSKGKHRICALHCGHLFGQACIERWLEERRSCPQCGAKVGPKGSHRVIPLFLTNLTAKDTGELETAMKRLDEEKRLRKQCEAERVRLAIENESLKDRVVRLSQRENTSTAGTNTATNRHANGRSSRLPPAVNTSCLTPPPGSTRAQYLLSSKPIHYPSSLEEVRRQNSATPSTVAHAVRPANNAGSEGGSCFSGECRESASVGLKFENALCKGLHSGRVAAFAGGAVGALLVSQEFRAAGGSHGAMLRHGVTKCSLADFRHQKNIFLHGEQVRDVKFSTQAGGSGYVLSTSFDRTLKVCDLRTDSVVIEYGVEGNGWSCQWSATDSNQMFCGIVDGSRTAAVMLYDLRSTSRAVRKLRAAAQQQQPIHSVCHTAQDELLCATMGGVWAWGGGTKGGDPGGTGAQEESVAEKLQIQAGPCCSLSQSRGFGADSDDASIRRFLVSTRGSSASHDLFSLEASSAPSIAISNTAEHSGVDVDNSAEQRHRRVSGYSPERSLWAQKWKKLPCVAQGHQSRHALSRSLLWAPGTNGNFFIAGGDERTNQPWIWDGSTGDVCHRLAAHTSPVLDIALLEEDNCGVGLLAAVSQGEMRLYHTSSQ